MAAQTLIGKLAALSIVYDGAELGEPFLKVGATLEECFIGVHNKVDNETKRLITAWKGGRKEREKYREGIARRT